MNATLDAMSFGQPDRLTHHLAQCGYIFGCSGCTHDDDESETP